MVFRHLFQADKISLKAMERAVLSFRQPLVFRTRLVPLAKMAVNPALKSPVTSQKFLSKFHYVQGPGDHTDFSDHRVLVSTGCFAWHPSPLGRAIPSSTPW